MRTHTSACECASAQGTKDGTRGSILSTLEAWIACLGPGFDARTRPCWKRPRNIYVRGTTATGLVVKRGKDV